MCVTRGVGREDPWSSEYRTNLGPIREYPEPSWSKQVEYRLKGGTRPDVIGWVTHPIDHLCHLCHLPVLRRRHSYHRLLSPPLAP